MTKRGNDNNLWVSTPVSSGYRWMQKPTKSAPSRAATKTRPTTAKKIRARATKKRLAAAKAKMALSRPTKAFERASEYPKKYEDTYSFSKCSVRAKQGRVDQSFRDECRQPCFVRAGVKVTDYGPHQQPKFDRLMDQSSDPLLRETCKYFTYRQRRNAAANRFRRVRR